MSVPDCDIYLIEYASVLCTVTLSHMHKGFDTSQAIPSVHLTLVRNFNTTFCFHQLFFEIIVAHQNGTFRPYLQTKIFHNGPQFHIKQY